MGPFRALEPTPCPHVCTSDATSCSFSGIRYARSLSLPCSTPQSVSSMLPPTTMRTAMLAHLFLLLIITALVPNVLSSALPPNCDPNQPEVDPGSCTYGTTRNSCGRTVCQKGPGEMCGGRFGRYGRCANGLMCLNCNRCQGCSFQFQTFICWDDKECIW